MLEGEEQFIALAKLGNAEAFTVLYNHYLPQIYRFVLIRTEKTGIAEDLVSEIFLNAWTHLPSYESQGHPISSWLYRIARNKIIDHRRTARQPIAIEDDDTEIALVDTGALLDDVVDARINNEQIMEVLRLLPEDYQTIITMRFIEDIEPKVIAAVVQKSEGAVRLMQHRAIQKLRKLLQKNNDENNSAMV